MYLVSRFFSQSLNVFRIVFIGHKKRLIFILFVNTLLQVLFFIGIIAGLSPAPGSSDMGIFNLSEGSG